MQTRLFEQLNVIFNKLENGETIEPSSKIHNNIKKLLELQFPDELKNEILEEEKESFFNGVNYKLFQEEGYNENSEIVVNVKLSKRQKHTYTRLKTSDNDENIWKKIFDKYKDYNEATIEFKTLPEKSEIKDINFNF